MGILTKRSVWQVARPAGETRRSSDLTPEEQARAKVAIRFLAKRHGSALKLAQAMRANLETVRSAMSKRGPVSAGIALRVARAAGVPLEDVLAGRWPVEGACPHCGRLSAGPLARDRGARLTALATSLSTQRCAVRIVRSVPTAGHFATIANMPGKLYYGDNLDVMRKKIQDESIDLCYIDPPFNSKRNYNQIYNNVGSEDRHRRRHSLTHGPGTSARSMGTPRYSPTNMGGSSRRRSH